MKVFHRDLSAQQVQFSRNVNSKLCIASTIIINLLIYFFKLVELIRLMNEKIFLDILQVAIYAKSLLS